MSRVLCILMGGHAWFKHQTVLSDKITHWDAEVVWCPSCKSVKSVEIIWPLRTAEALARLGEVDVAFHMDGKGKVVAYPPKG